MPKHASDLEGKLKGAILAAAKSSTGVIIGVSDIELTSPKGGSNADLSCPVSFRLASKLGKSPHEIAQSLTDSLSRKKSPDFQILPPQNGFLNFSYSNSQLHKFLSLPLKEGKNFGKGNAGKKQKAIVEFSSPNIGKPMHIGHIRSTILGDSLAKVLAASGYKAISSNYLCEAGLQTAKLLLAIKLFKTRKISSEKDLLALYVEIHRQMESNPELEKQAQELVLKMETGDPATLRELTRVRKLSTQPFNRNYALLGIKFDEEVYDSDYVKDGKAMVDLAIEKGVAKRDTNGEVFADLEERFKQPNLIILRSNGTTLYSTRDLGLARRQFSKYKFDRRIYVTASEQNTHFRQVFAILRALGEPYADRLFHIGFGLISLEEGKLSTREGRVLLLEDVINESISLALDEVKKRQQYSDEAASEIARIVGIASLKYSILKISSEKDIKFSMRDAVKFDGNTAAYLQYTCVRARNIQKKALDEKYAVAGASEGKVEQSKSSSKSNIRQSKSNANYPFNADEKKLILLISQFPQTLEHAARNLSPYIICDFLFRLALQFSSFYDTCPVLKAQSSAAREMRLQIVRATETVMQNGLALLGIEVPERM
ncbi:MAG: arginine--tRNA ligase [Candidatus Micrarchaeota archaeon]